MHAMHILLRCARTTLVTCMRNTAMSETCTAVSRLLQEWVVFNVNSGMIIGVNMPFGMIIGHGPCVEACRASASAVIEKAAQRSGTLFGAGNARVLFHQASGPLQFFPI